MCRSSITEIDEIDSILGANENILQFDVMVDKVVGVDVLERREQFLQWKERGNPMITSVDAGFIPMR